MKRIYNAYILPLALCLMGVLMTACGDNGEYWGQHVLTDDEIAEMERQQRIQDSLRTVINADLLLDYELDVTCSEGGYDGGTLSIDLGVIAEKFGITVDQLKRGILNMRTEIVGSALPNAADISGFAIQGTTHSDVMTAYNTNAWWGHWWDENGDVTAWGDNARVFAEWDGYDSENDVVRDEPFFNIGQMPGKLVAGQDYVFMEGLKYQDIRVVVRITVHAKEREAVAGGIVGEQTLTLETQPNDTYATVPVPGFDAQKVLSDLGASSWSQVSWVATNADGSYAQEYNADPNPGFWYGQDGFKGAWGDNASIFVTFNADEQTLYVGQMPEKMPVGSSVSVEFNAVYGDKIEKIVINVMIVAYQDPETAPEGTPESIERSITLTKRYDNQWGATEELDVKEELRQCFKMTTYQIFSALKSGEMKMWVNEIGNMAAEDGMPAYTGEAPGWWLNGEGAPVAWGAEAIAYVFLGISETSLTFYGGNHPDNCSPAGQTINTKYIIERNGVTATYNIKFDITAAE